MTKLRATLIYMLKEKEPQINKTKHRLLRGILMETLKEIQEQAMNKLEDLINKRITSFQAQIQRTTPFQKSSCYGPSEHEDL